MRIGSSRTIFALAGWTAIFLLNYREAPAGYFVTAFVQSPLATYDFGDVDKSGSATADSATFFTNGSNVFSAEASADVDLSTGVLHSLVSNTDGYDPGNPPYGTVFVFSNAGMGDSLTFKGNFTGQTVVFHATVSGGWSNMVGSPLLQPAFQLSVLPAGTIDANAGNIVRATHQSSESHRQCEPQYRSDAELSHSNRHSGDAEWIRSDL